MALYLKQAGLFTAHSSLFTVKAVLTSTEVDDARPTIVRREDEKSVWSVLSGKVSTLFDLEDGLT
jgi:1,2-phenylacetyl-CoA epoxidase PaaB subunit